MLSIFYLSWASSFAYFLQISFVKVLVVVLGVNTSIWLLALLVSSKLPVILDLASTLYSQRLFDKLQTSSNTNCYWGLYDCLIGEKGVIILDQSFLCAVGEAFFWLVISIGERWLGCKKKSILEAEVSEIEFSLNGIGMLRVLRRLATILNFMSSSSCLLLNTILDAVEPL